MPEYHIEPDLKGWTYDLVKVAGIMVGDIYLFDFYLRERKTKLKYKMIDLTPKPCDYKEKVWRKRNEYV